MESIVDLYKIEINYWWGGGARIRKGMEFKKIS